MLRDSATPSDCLVTASLTQEAESRAELLPLGAAEQLSAGAGSAPPPASE